MGINIERLMANIEQMGRIGRSDLGGQTRVAFTPTYLKGEEFVLGLMQEAELTVRKDGLGNFFGWMNGQVDSPVIMAGSHIDSVPEGGMYDGVLGVLAPLECLRTMKEEGITPYYPIEVVSFNAEEGGLLGGTFGSRASMGEVDISNPIILEGFQRMGISPADLKASAIDHKKVRAFIELHIEQGGVLDAKGIPLGIVTGIVHICRYKVTVKGVANHSGTTPMAMRKDALVKACGIVIGIQEFANKLGDGLVATVGDMTVLPGAINVVPGEVFFPVDVRSLDDDRLAAMEKKLIELTTGEDTKLETHIKMRGAMMNNDLQMAIENAAVKLDYAYQNMPSGAGHDAATMGRHLVPTAMIFVPSKDGISHSPDEFTSREDIEKGANLLYETLLTVK